MRYTAGRSIPRREIFLLLTIVMALLIGPGSLGCSDPDAWEKRQNRWQPPEQVMDAIGVKPGMTIGEIGAGRGRYTVHLAARVGTEGKIYANDIDTDKLEYLRQRCERDSIENVETILGEETDPKFPKRSLDLVFMINTYHHIEQPIALMKNILPALKPDGFMAIVDHDPEKVPERVDHTTDPAVLDEQAREAGWIIAGRETFLERDNIFLLRPSERREVEDMQREGRARDDTTAVRFGSLIDGSGRVFTDAVVIVSGERIVAVLQDTDPIPKGARHIDLGHLTGIPGLVDVHTHMTYYWDRLPGTNPWGQWQSMNPAVTVSLAGENARKTLEAGVTTVRDLGAFDPGSCTRMDIAMRDLIDRGTVPGPRMKVAGYGLLATRAVGRPGEGFPKWGFADGVDEVRRVVEREIAAGVDWIKMFASTGSADDVTGEQTFSDEEIETAVRTAQEQGVRVAIHTYGPSAARAAVRSGANSIEHATGMDDRTIEEMVRKNIFYVPTIDHNRYYIEHADEYGYGSDAIEGLRDYVERNLETARKAFEAGVPFAMGSDAVFTMFGRNTRELECFVEAGMSPGEALAAATTGGAKLLGMENEIGKVAPGYFADIVAVEGDPLADIGVVVRNVRWVMKDGSVVVDRRNTE